MVFTLDDRDAQLHVTELLTKVALLSSLLIGPCSDQLMLSAALSTRSAVIV